MRTLEGPEGLVAEVGEHSDVGLEFAVAVRLRFAEALIAGAVASARHLTHPRLVSFAISESPKSECCDDDREDDTEPERLPFVAEVVDDSDGTNGRLSGRLGAFEEADFSEAEGQAFVTAEEIEAAAAVVRRDEQFRRLIGADQLDVVPAMPGVVLHGDKDGRTRRLVTMALRDLSGAQDVAYRLVDVDAVLGEIVQIHHPVPSAGCGSPDDGEHGDGSSSGQVHVTVRQGAQTLWTLVVQRPGISSAFGGCGLSVRAVGYRGHRVLYRGDTPIVNVLYDNTNHSGAKSYRDWLYQEAAFRAVGTDVIPGYRVCTSAPQTIFDEDANGQSRAGGNFNGVSFHWDGQWLVVTSVMAAGWYRYRAEWRFHVDGRIVPTFGFAAVSNPNTCDPHQHHCYWRLDFDIDTAGNNRVEQRQLRFLPADPSSFTFADVAHRPFWGERFRIGWSTVATERRMDRDLFSAWRVSNTTTGRGYVIYPGANDGHHDNGFGTGDVWALRYRASEDHDPRQFADDSAHIDDFVNGESIIDTDVVVWYAGHAHHDQHHDDLTGEHGHVVGPILTPHQW